MEVCSPTSPKGSAPYSDIQGGYAGEGNIALEPVLADPASNDYHLQRASPCIDAGNNVAVLPSLTTDFEGDARVLDGDGDETAVVDMGADEYTP